MMKTLVKNIFLLIFFVLGALLVPAQAIEATVDKTPVPEWVAGTEIPGSASSRQDQHKNGQAWLLSDSQYDWDGHTKRSFYRTAVEIISRQGLEDAATIELVFDPQVENLELHSVKLHRNHEVIDVTGSIEFEILRREEELEDGILDGRLTAHANIEGVQVGDVVEIARSWIETRPVFKDRLTFIDRLSYSVPVAFSQTLLRVPEGLKFDYASYGTTTMAPDIRTLGGHDIYTWQSTDTVPVPDEKDRPGEYPLYSYLEVSDWKSWNDVRDALLDGYRLQQVLPLSYRQKIEEIQAATKSPAIRMSRALQFVQDDIRYVGLEIGAGGYIPRQPALVVDRGFGDCKDKALLLTAVLRDLGIKSAVALVNTVTGYGLSERLPSPYRFDHAIVRAEIGDKVFWLDPTWSHRGGTGKNIVQPSYGYALVISEETDGLELMPVWQPNGPEVQVSESYWLPRTSDQSVQLEVKSVFKDREADYMRRTFAQYGKAEIGRKYASYYSQRYPGMIPSEDLRFVDNRDANEVRIYESYTLAIEDFARPDTLTDFKIQADTVLEKLPSPSSYQRKSPVALDGPVSYEHSVRISDPIRGFSAPEEIAIENDAFSYHRTTPSSGNKIWLRWQLDIKQRTIGADQIDRYLREVRQASDESYLSYDFSNYFQLLKSSAANASPAEVVLPDEDGNVGVVLGILLLAGGLVYLVLALRHGLKADLEHRDEAIYFPVSVSKFLILSCATFGLYPVFWMLKFWFWTRRNETGGIWPVWRTIFAPLWLYPAFRRANNRLGVLGKSLPVWLGVAGAAGYLLVHFLETALGESLNAAEFMLLLVVLPLLGGICFLPGVVAVNRSNYGNHIALNSRWSLWNYSAVLLYLSLLSIILIGGFAA